MHNKNFIFFGLLFIVIFSCKKDDFKWNLKKAPEIGSLSIVSNGTSEFKLESECLSIGNDKNVEMGYCWSETSQEPTLDDNVIFSSEKKVGKFDITFAWKNISKYYLRAFIKNSIATAYSQSIIVNWPGDMSLPTIQTININEVSFYSMKVNCAILTTNNQPILSKGVYISTSSNPNSNNSYQLFSSTDGALLFSHEFLNLENNTTYYTRGFVKTLAGEGVGNILSVTLPKKYTIGETGPTGGIVFYENPNLVDSWHYLEVANMDITATSFWSPIVNQSDVTSTLTGSGFDNTYSILSIYGNSTSYAALDAYSWIHSGYSDWFLPSLDELKLLKENIFEQGLGNFSSGSFYWSSSEDENYYQNAWTVNMNNTGVNNYTSQPKSSLFKIRCIRRF